MTRDTYQQSWSTGVELITKLDHYFTATVSVNHFGAFEIIPNPQDTAPLKGLCHGDFADFWTKLS